MEQKPLMLSVKQADKAWKCYLRRLALEAGLPDNYRPTVMFLARKPGASQKAIAESYQVTSAAVSQTVRDMQRDGYITKEIDEDDQRVAKLYLTEKGQSAADKMRDGMRAADKIITAAITPKKEAELMEGLAMLREAIIKELLEK